MVLVEKPLALKFRFNLAKFKKCGSNERTSPLLIDFFAASE